MHIIDTICLKQFCLKIEKICLEIQKIFLEIQNICLKSKMRAREHSSECLIYVKSKKLLIETEISDMFLNQNLFQSRLSQSGGNHL